MSRDKQTEIDEMAKYICKACERGNGFGGGCCEGNDYIKCGISIETAQDLYNAGYRKASFVIDEVIKIVSEKAEEEIEYFDRMRVKGKDGRYFEGGKHTCEMLLLEFAELKKKYTERSENGK